MASFRKVNDGNRCLVDREKFVPKAMKSKVGLSGRLFNLEYDVSSKEA